MRYVREEEDCIVDGLEKLAERVVSSTEEDKAILSRRVLESIECAIGLNLPDRKKCIKLKRMNEIYWKDPIPLNLGTKIQEPPHAEPITRVVKQTQAKCAGMAGESKRQLVFEQPTLYEMNNISLEKPWHKDPNATETVEELMSFMEETSDWDREKLDLDSGQTAGEKGRGIKRREKEKRIKKKGKEERKRRRKEKKEPQRN